MTADILSFPTRNKGRVRKSKGAQAEGVCAMLQFGGAGDNVVHFDRGSVLEADAFRRVEILSYAFTKLLNKLPQETQSELSRSFMIDAVFEKDAARRRAAVALCHSFRHFRLD